MAHSSIEARIQKLGLAYEKQHNRTRELEREIVAFFGYSQGILQKLIDQNNQLVDTLQKTKLPEDVFGDDAKRSDQIAQMVQTYTPDFRELVASKPLMDRIFNFEPRLIKDLKMLEVISGMEQQSKHVMGLLEEEHRKLQPTLEILQRRLANCKKQLEEVNRFSQHTLN